MNNEWRLQAACRGMLNFTDTSQVGRKNNPHDERRKTICRRCPVRQQCLDYALNLETIDDARWGVIYGGLTGTERAKILARKKAAA